MEEIVEEVISRLKEAGIVVQRYDAVTTNSVYLKLDFGMCNSVRISDHKGKRHLAYRYNLLTVCPRPMRSKTRQGHERLYCPLDQYETMVRKIIFDRDMKLKNLGHDYYTYYMLKNRKEGQKKKGFWQKARIV